MTLCGDWLKIGRCFLSILLQQRADPLHVELTTLLLFSRRRYLECRFCVVPVVHHACFDIFRPLTLGCHRTLKAAAMEAYARGYRRAGLDEDTAASLLRGQEERLDVQER